MTAGLTGTAALSRRASRRDRIMLPVWVYVIIGSTASTAYTLKKLYPQASSRAALAATASSNPALRFLYGRLYGDSIGALAAWRYGVWAALFTVVMTVFLVVRHTRADEESGRLELVGSAAVGRRAPLPAGLLPDRPGPPSASAGSARTGLAAATWPAGGLAERVCGPVRGVR